MDDEPEVNEFDQFMFFAGSNMDDLEEFQAEVELPLGKEGKKQIINGPAMVHIPGGLVHGPVNFKNIKKPIVYYSIYLSPKHSMKWDESTDYGKYVGKPKAEYIKSVTKNFAFDETPFRHLVTSTRSLNAWCSPLGLKGNLCWGYNVVTHPGLAWEPVHYHNHVDEWIIYMGSNPLDVEEFDAETEMWWGEEREKHVLDCTCVTHMPPGQIHCSNDHRRVGKPFYEIITVTSNDYFAEKDKVVVSEEERGDVMITKGAIDYGW
jgi:hypothetical protein